MRLQVRYIAVINETTPWGVCVGVSLMYIYIYILDRCGHRAHVNGTTLRDYMKGENALNITNP